MLFLVFVNSMLELALLFLAASVAAAISGAAGFGGALLLLPLLVTTVGTEQAVPLLTVAQFVGNLSRASFGFRQIRWKPVVLFLAGAVPFSVLGAISFVSLPKGLVTRCIGAVILFFVALHYYGLVDLKPRAPLLVAGGCVAGFLSGLVGSAGPLGATIFLSLGLPPVSYVASEATTALTMHGVKTVVYQQYISFDKVFWAYALLVSLAMVLGTWAANRVITRIPTTRFRRYVGGLLVIMAIYMVILG